MKPCSQWGESIGASMKIKGSKSIPPSQGHEQFIIVKFLGGREDYNFSKACGHLSDQK